MRFSRIIETSKSRFKWAPTSVKKSIEAEEKLLSNGIDLNLCDFGHVQINENDHINTLHIRSNSNVPLVITHGYGAGLGFFYRNYSEISTSTSIYSLDWLGMANSSRSKFPRLPIQQSEHDMVSKTEDYFIDALENWREKVGLEKMVLMGHSLGGYLCSAYSLKYPSRVKKLILVSPAGVPAGKPVQKKSKFSSVLMYLLQRNLSPFSVVRSAGPFGPKLVNSYTSRRFAHLSDSERKDFHEYIYHIAAQRGSGEFALARLLLPGAYGRNPLIHRLPLLEIPITFLYGSHDWMNFNYAVEAANLIPRCRVALIKNTGHHLYLEKPATFNKAIMNELQQIVPVPDLYYVFRNY